MWLPPRHLDLVSVQTSWGVFTAGAVVFGLAAVLVSFGSSHVDAGVYVALNQVPSGVADVLTPLSKLFLPLGLCVAVVLGAVYCVVRTRTLWPVTICAGAAALAWLADNAAKHVADRPRPYTVVAGAVLRQAPPHGSSFPSSHTAVVFAVAIAAIPYIPRRGVPIVVVYAALVGWSRVYLGAHYPLDVLAGMGLGVAIGGVALLVARRVHRAPELHLDPAPPPP